MNAAKLATRTDGEKMPVNNMTSVQRMWVVALGQHKNNYPRPNYNGIMDSTIMLVAAPPDNAMKRVRLRLPIIRLETIREAIV